MFKSLIGLSAMLSLSLLATVASAGPRPAALDKIDQVARPAPVARETFRHNVARPATHVVRADNKSSTKARPAQLQRLQVRGDIVVGTASRSVTSVTRDMQAASKSSARNPVMGRVAQRARCEDSTACGSSASSDSRVATARTSGTNAQKDGVTELRRHVRNERLYRMIMAKIMAKTHPGK